MCPPLMVPAKEDANIGPKERPAIIRAGPQSLARNSRMQKYNRGLSRRNDGGTIECFGVLQGGHDDCIFVEHYIECRFRSLPADVGRWPRLLSSYGSGLQAIRG
jgi:hypothetical protein